MTTTTQTRTISWAGLSGQSYKYWIYPIGTSFNALPGNYIYTRETQPDTFVPIYIGETENLAERTLSTHHKRDCINRNGATHIHVHESSNSVYTRRAEEKDLVERWNPCCND